MIPGCRSLDLEYHRLDVAEGLYYGLEQGERHAWGAGWKRGAGTPSRSLPRQHALTCGAGAFKSLPRLVVSAQWDHITLQGSNGPIKISLLDLFAPEEILRYGSAIDAASTPDDLRMLNTMS